jgi:hypothetical protein
MYTGRVKDLSGRLWLSDLGTHGVIAFYSVKNAALALGREVKGGAAGSVRTWYGTEPQAGEHIMYTGRVKDLSGRLWLSDLGTHVERLWMVSTAIFSTVPCPDRSSGSTFYLSPECQGGIFDRIEPKNRPVAKGFYRKSC